MCFFPQSAPAAPVVPEVTKPAEVKQVASQGETGAFGSTISARKNMAQTGGPASSTLLTGPTGIENKQLSLGKTTLLGQ